MLDAGSILSALSAEGFTVELGPGDKLLVGPASAMHGSHRDLLRANKPAIVKLLLSQQRRAEAEAAELIAAAMRRCNQFGDGPEAREQMRQDCINTPPHLRRDLLNYFQSLSGGRS